MLDIAKSVDPKATEANGRVRFEFDGEAFSVVSEGVSGTIMLYKGRSLINQFSNDPGDKLMPLLRRIYARFCRLKRLHPNLKRRHLTQGKIMPRPSTDLDFDPQVESLATYLREWLNTCVDGEVLVGEAIAVDAFVAYLETDANFPLLQVSRGEGRGQGRIESTTIYIEYVLPSGLDLLLSRSGWLYVVGQEIEKALQALEYNPEILGHCASITSIQISPRFLAFIDQSFPMLSVVVEFTGG
ncbi:MAG: hypothetical protein HC771_13080 [Synechococcales cyanobacterium CRU_2_2]|nr:hypothetical protein [Synechococcales cyanobacterium CRU_2_2]